MIGQLLTTTGKKKQESMEKNKVHYDSKTLDIWAEEGEEAKMVGDFDKLTSRSG